MVLDITNEMKTVKTTEDIPSQSLNLYVFTFQRYFKSNMPILESSIKMQVDFT